MKVLSMHISHRMKNMIKPIEGKSADNLSGYFVKDSIDELTKRDRHSDRSTV